MVEDCGKMCRDVRDSFYTLDTSKPTQYAFPKGSTLGGATGGLSASVGSA